MNEESLKRANAFLAAVALRVEVGETLDAPPTDIGREIGIDQPLASARAIRALPRPAPAGARGRNLPAAGRASGGRGRA